MATSPQPSFLNPRGSTAIADSNDGFDIFQARAGNVLLWYVRNDGSIVFPDGSVQSTASTGGSLSLAAFGSTPNANGGSVSGSVLTLQPADATHPGGVSTGAQTFAGAKTITGANGDIVLNPAAASSYSGVFIGSNAFLKSYDAGNTVLGFSNFLYLAAEGNVFASIAVSGTGDLDLSSGTLTTSKLINSFTDLSGTPGAGTANTTTGTAAVVMGSSATFKITCSKVVSTSLIMVSWAGVDSTAGAVSAVATTGGFNVSTVGVAAGNTKFNWWVIN